MVALILDALQAFVLEFAPVLDRLFQSQADKSDFSWAGTEWGYSGILNTVIKNVFEVEIFISGGIGAIDGMMKLAYSVGFALIVFKFLRKGFAVYILWHDGDADSSPLDMLKSAILAVVFAICFPTMYDWFAEFSVWLCGKGVEMAGLREWSFGASAKQFIGSMIDTAIGPIGSSTIIVDIVIFLAMMICCLILWFQFVGRGVELLVLRIGFPIACVGLLDSDGGVFKPYVKLFVQTLFTTVIQVTLLMFACNLFSTDWLPDKFIAFGVMIAAIKTPKMMQQLLLQVGGGGGGLTNKIYAGGMIARTVGSFMGK